MLSTTHRGRPRLWVESLEARENPAGSVSVFVGSDGLLYVVGDSGGNQVSIQQDSSGAIVVTGQNGTAVNGRADGSVSASAPARGLVVRTGDGADVIQLSGVNLSSLSVDTVGGNDSITVSSVNVANDATINAGAGNDTVSLRGLYAGGNTTVDGGAGTDRLIGNYATAGGILFETGFETR